MPQTNPLLRMIEANAVPLGMQCFTADHALIEVLGLTGFDFVMLDTEHSPTNPRAIEDAIRATDGAGLVPLVRVPSADDETAIRRSLEAGAQGLFVPMVRTAADLERVVDAALFPPLGTRGPNDPGVKTALPLLAAPPGPGRVHGEPQRRQGRRVPHSPTGQVVDRCCVGIDDGVKFATNPN